MNIIKNNKTTSNNLIAKRKELSTDITKYWGFLKTENVVRKGTVRNYDMKRVLDTIFKMSEERIKTKLAIQCINMGLTSFSDLSEDNNYINIYTQSEKKEQYDQLGRIKTIDPKLKRAKGKKGLNDEEELTSAFIADLRKKLQIEINKLDKAMTDFNNREFNMAESSDEIPSNLSNCA